MVHECRLISTSIIDLYLIVATVEVQGGERANRLVHAKYQYESRWVTVSNFLYSTKKRKDPYLFGANTISAARCLWAGTMTFCDTNLSISIFSSSRAFGPNTLCAVCIGWVFSGAALMRCFAMFTCPSCLTHINWNLLSMSTNCSR